tara:strand:- start:175 stop:387 length:213 start_codon:yes stop_codon:yes gene_type:complete
MMITVGSYVAVEGVLVDSLQGKGILNHLILVFIGSFLEYNFLTSCIIRVVVARGRAIVDSLSGKGDPGSF